MINASLGDDGLLKIIFLFLSDIIIGFSFDSKLIFFNSFAYLLEI